MGTTGPGYGVFRDDAVRAKAAKLIKEGKTYREVGKALHISYNAVSAAARRGVLPRSNNPSTGNPRSRVNGEGRKRGSGRGVKPEPRPQVVIREPAQPRLFSWEIAAGGRRGY